MTIPRRDSGPDAAPPRGDAAAPDETSERDGRSTLGDVTGRGGVSGYDGESACGGAAGPGEGSVRDGRSARGDAAGRGGAAGPGEGAGWGGVAVVGDVAGCGGTSVWGGVSGRGGKEVRRASVLMHPPFPRARAVPWTRAGVLLPGPGADWPSRARIPARTDRHPSADLGP
ncbi:hypothetical protein GCM10010377_61990 [Streptomyces viridiviolaceus]|nr:hypothetical protein GCM10010377_61990 [Streptomyces viridiviolaceus]